MLPFNYLFSRNQNIASCSGLSVATGERGSLCLLKHLTSSWARYQIHVLNNLRELVLFDFAEISTWWSWIVKEYILFLLICGSYYAKVIYRFEVIFLKRFFFQCVSSLWFFNPRLTPMEKINDLWNEHRNIQLVNYICSLKNFQWKKKGFLMVNVHNSKTRTLQNKDSALQRNVQHKLVWRLCNLFRPCCGVAKSVRNFDATYHDVTP